MTGKKSRNMFLKAAPVLTVILILMSAIIPVSCSKKDTPAAPSAPAGTPTITPTITATGTITTTHTITPTATMTLTCTEFPTNTPVIYISAFITTNEHNLYANYSAYVDIDGGDCADAVLTVEDLDNPASPVPVPYVSGDYYAYGAIGLAYVPGHTFRFTVTADGRTFFADQVLPGGASIAADGLSCTWTSQPHPGDGIVEIFDSAYSVIYFVPADTSPTIVSPDPYTVPGTYHFNCQLMHTAYNYQDSTIFSGADSGSSIYTEAQMMIDIVKP
jgi:hypothetical protein